MPATDAPDLLVVGPSRHGVTRYARDLAAAAEAGGFARRPMVVADGAAAARAVVGADRVHAHVTDRLFGSTPEEAAETVEQLAALTRLTITLHDLPQGSDGSAYARRAAAYGRFIDASDGVVVNSRHEAELVVEHLGLPAASVTVIPLGTTAEVPLSSDPRSPIPGRLTVLIAGYIYPGKGHLDAIEAAATVVSRLRADGTPIEGARVVAIGGPSRGHEADVERLRVQARELGVDLEVTGVLDDDEFERRLAADGIPVAAHQHLSASRSMSDWAERGRRPLVRASRYAREMDALRPGTLTMYAPSDLSDALLHAWRSPDSTRVPPRTSLRPTLSDAALAYRDWWSGLALR
ncbi:glycosyltransferase [Leifsonia sp. YIM 134122]|uniref:Glycosyltransferase n=1 Tax=Leifsonia stereocauli TaxID=3134136 RepID=A0ABU9VZC4_9MICO